MAFAIGVFSIRLMIVDHQFCMAAHSSEKDLFSAPKGALESRLSIVPLAGEEGVPSRFSEPLGKGHLRLGDVEDISRQSMQRTTRHHHVAARRADRSTGRPHAVGAVETDPLAYQTIERRGLDLLIAQRTDGVRPLVIGNDPQDVGRGGCIIRHRLHRGEDQQDHQRHDHPGQVNSSHEHFSCRPFRPSSKSLPMKESIHGTR